MRPCTAVVLAPLALWEFVRLDGPPVTVVGPWEPWQRCRIALWHRGDHASRFGDRDDDPDHALWLLWSTGGSPRIGWQRFCGQFTPGRDDVCTFFSGHPREHSWDVVDPAVERLWRQYKVNGAGFPKTVRGRETGG
ncbi:hypothetical protein ABTX35_18625 [Streptomyces sp. NPDC096080]|uniref:hypothetical protein n=1 Tax=Streptomyces sp. NPDC096080 TaxID=3156693 RepID=UPI003317EAF8